METSTSEIVCLQCGDVGFSNAYVYCVKCHKFVVHRYCLNAIPKSIDEFVLWLCDDCEADEKNQHYLLKNDPTSVCNIFQRDSAEEKRSANAVSIMRKDHYTISNNSSDRPYKESTNFSFNEHAKLASDSTLLEDAKGIKASLKRENGMHHESDPETTSALPPFTLNSGSEGSSKKMAPDMLSSAYLNDHKTLFPQNLKKQKGLDLGTLPTDINRSGEPEVTKDRSPASNQSYSFNGFLKDLTLSAVPVMESIWSGCVDFQPEMAKRREEDLMEAEEARTKSKHNRPQRPRRVCDELSDDDIVDTPHSRGVRCVRGRGLVDENEARTKARDDRPRKPGDILDNEVLSVMIGRKRKAKEIIGGGSIFGVTKVTKGKGLAKKGKGKNVPGEKSYLKLTTRTSPFSLVKSYEEMTEAQKDAVKELGFSRILRLSITDIPSRLAYWVVNSFDARSCELILGSGTRLSVESSDVNRVFGFPMGNINIDVTRKNEKCKLLVEWTNMFEPGKTKIGQKDIIQRMLGDKEGGVWFKRNFMILLVSSLIENTSHGYVTPKIMGYLEDVEKIKEMDWCKYTMKCLLNNKRNWDREKHKTFLGSALFLTLFFVDRVLLFDIKCERTFPTCLNWNNDSLRNRERDEINSGGFGYGRPLDPIQQISERDVEEENDRGGPSVSDAPKREDYAMKLLRNARDLVEKVLETIQIIEGAPAELADDIYFQKAVRATKNLFQGSFLDKPQQIDELQTQLSETQEDKFWCREAILKIIQEVEAANVKKNDFLSMKQE